jgi:hypothetical protein
MVNQSGVEGDGVCDEEKEEKPRTNLVNFDFVIGHWVSVPGRSAKANVLQTTTISCSLRAILTDLVPR